MSTTGSRLYSIKEIKEMINQEFTEDFISYLCRAPQNIINIIEIWRDDSLESISQIVSEYKSNHVEEFYDKSITIEYEKYVNESTIEEITDTNLEDTIGIALVDEPVQCVENNPYEEMEFGDRLKVDKIYVNVVDELACLKDSHYIRKIQVMAKMPGGGYFSNMMDCCARCKGLLVKKEAVESKKRLFEKKHIEFEFKEICKDES